MGEQETVTYASQEQHEEDGISAALKVSLISLLTGCAFMIYSLLFFFIYVPLFMISFILSVVAMSNDELKAGIGMLIGSVIIPLIIFCAMMVDLFQ